MMVLDMATSVFTLIAGGLVLEVFANGIKGVRQKDQRAEQESDENRLDLPEFSALENPS
jgi:hypothetical protein